MDNSVFCPESCSDTRKSPLNFIIRDRHRLEALACITLGVIFGCVTQAIYGNSDGWGRVIECYCASFENALLTISPVTLGYVVLMFLFAPSEWGRMMIFPVTALRGMGLGALIAGAVQSGNVSVLCFASTVLFPYAAINVLLAVFAGEYTLGFCESLHSWNEGLSDKLHFHAVKMLLLYTFIAAGSCLIFAASCYCFGKYVT